MDGDKEDGEGIHHKEIAEISIRSAIEDNSLNKQITRIERLHDTNGFWLSSANRTSSVLSFDAPEFDCNKMFLHDQFSSQLSLSSSNGLNDEMSAVLDWPLKSAKKGTNEEEVMKWTLNSVKYFPFVPSECSDSSYDSSLSEHSSVISSPCTSFTVHSDTQSEDFDRTDIWVSSLDLDKEDTTLIQDNEQGFDIFDSDFPSPSFSGRKSEQFSSSSPSLATSHQSEAKIMSEDDDSDEPIFWPFERSSYNSPEFEKFLSVSPRRSTMDFRFAGACQVSTTMLRLHQNNLSAAQKDIQAHRGRMNLSAKRTKVSPNKAQKIAAVPSRLSRSTEASSDNQPPNNCKRNRPALQKINVQRHGSSLRLVDLPLQELETDDLQNLVSEKIPIEEFVGLDEFDGHEGINADAWTSQFNICGSPP